MAESVNLEEFKNIYLIDKVADEDKFNHQDFADILWRLIKDNTAEEDKSPFNIGIFGKWGTGKSTIVNLFKKEIASWNGRRGRKKEYKFIEFKVWKYSKEALRRKFIFTIGKELIGERELDRIHTEVRARRTFSQSLLISPEYLIKQLQDWKNNISWPLVGWGLGLSTIIVLVLLLVNYRFSLEWFKSLSDFLVVLFPYLACLIPAVLNFFLRALNKARVSISFSPYDTEEQFEEKFVSYVEAEKELIKIIFIDDLDRCSDEKVIEALETIKTYLDIETCIFIIACDEDCIRRVIEKKRSELCQKGDGVNYLNKFFQYTLRIPPFIHQNMQEYAKKILISQNNDLLKLKDINDILYVLIHDEVQNPRKAISLINNFALDFEVIMKREQKDSAKLRKGDVSECLPVLAVLTVIKTDYPFFYQLLIKDSNLFSYLLWVESGKTEFIEDYHTDILREIYFSNVANGKLDFKRYKDEVARNFVTFIQKVGDFVQDVDNIQLFIYLNADQSSHSLKTERLRDLRKYVRGGINNKVVEMVKDLKTNEDKLNHFRVINITIGQAKLPIEIKNSLSCLFDVVELIPESPTDRKLTSMNAVSKLSKQFFSQSEFVERINLNGLCFVLDYVSSYSTKQEQVNKIVDALEKTTDKSIANKIFNASCGHQHLVDTDSNIQRMVKFLSRRQAIDDNDKAVYFSLEDICKFILDLKDNKEAILKFFSSSIAEEICDKLTEIDSKDKKNEAEEAEYTLLKNAFDIIDDNILNEEIKVSKRLHLLIKLLPTKNYYFTVIEKLYKSIDRMPDDILPIAVKALSQEVENLDDDSNNLKKLLELIDVLSLKIKQKPISELSFLKKSLVDIMLDCSDKEEFEFVMHHFVKFSDGRLSESDSNEMLERLFTNFKISKRSKTLPKICTYILDNSSILKTVSVKKKLFDAFFNDVHRVETYDKAKFPNDEGIKYWKSVAPRIMSISQNRDEFITKMDVNSCILAVNRNELPLNQKSFLVDIVKDDIQNYGKPALEHLLNILVPYISHSDGEKIKWGVNQIYLLVKKIKINDLSEEIKKKLIVSLSKALTDAIDNETKSQALEILIEFTEKILTMEDSHKKIVLKSVESEFKEKCNHKLAFDGFAKLHNHYGLAKQAKICNYYTKSDVYNKENSEKLITIITKEFSQIPAMGKNDKNEKTAENDVKIPTIDFIEKYTTEVNTNEKSTEFFRKLFSKLMLHLKKDIGKRLSEDNIHKIKTESEDKGIRRNRFTILQLLMFSGILGESDMFGVFSNLFSSESNDNVRLAVEQFPIYYPNPSKISRESRKGYKVAIEQSSERVSDDALKEKLKKISKTL